MCRTSEKLFNQMFVLLYYQDLIMEFLSVLTRKKSFWSPTVAAILYHADITLETDKKASLCAHCF